LIDAADIFFIDIDSPDPITPSAKQAAEHNPNFPNPITDIPFIVVIIVKNKKR